MLKSTGYFRAIECPFGECCRRPYCHFRHRGRGVWASTPGEARTGAEYDPYSPDLRKGALCLDGVLEVVPEPGLDILELERVNKAIEAVKSEVEREQKKYEELLETQKDYSVTRKSNNPFSHLEYDPGCYGSSGTYNPTPLSRSRKGSKYTLDDGDRATRKTKCLEYVPTAVTRAPKDKTNKYVIDNSKPPTDMEYDPMSNYSARLLSKDKRQRTKRDRLDSLDEGYSPSPKKMCNSVYEVSLDARFSESDGETEPVVLKSASKSFCSKKTQKASAKSPKYAAVEKKSKPVKEIDVQYNMDDVEKPLKNHSKCSKDSKHKCKNETKTVPEEQPKLGKSENIDLAKKLKGKSKIPGKRKSENVNNGENRAGHKLKTKSSKPEKTSEKLILVKDPVKGSSSHSKNEKLDKKHAKDQKNKKHVHGKSGDTRNGIVKAKSNSITPSGIKGKSKQRTLSHVDLFGDESSEEEDAVKVRKLGLHQSSLGSDGGGHSDPEGESNMKISKCNHRRNSTSSGDSVAIDYSALENELDSDSDPMEECLRVFNESQEVKTEDKGRMGKQSQEKTEQTLATGQKRRISHVTVPNSSVSASKPVVRPYNRPTPQEICYQRIQRAQEQATQLLSQKKALQLNSTERSSFSIRHNKKRIAHFPGSHSSTSSSCQLVSSEAKTRANSEIDEASNTSAQSLKTRTLSGMTSKTTSTVVQRRQAHIPSLQSATLKRPVIPTEFGAKVPTTVRQRYLNLFIDECLKSSCTEQEAFDKALEEEKIVYNRSSSRNIYLNMAVNALTKLRNKGQGTKPVTSECTNKRVTSHESVLGGRRAAKTSYSMQRSTGHQAEELTDVLLYTKLKEYILTPDQLQLHGYPVAHPDKPGRILLTAEEKKTDSSCRVCCRCGSEYLVVPSGKCLRREECVHHWGRLRRQKVSGGWETLYSCCSGAVGSTGCQVAKQHVHNRKEPQDGFVKSLEKPPTEDGNSGVYALDCEMCYTTQGLELTRVTVINSHLKVVYDTFVKPENAIVDYNTRFSGVTEEDMQNTTTSLRDVQAVLLSMFNCDTILIGHSLESDLFALKLIHQAVVDTAIVFPHHLGLPYKRALRSLMADYLKRIIQDSVDGHDSSEDACSCMELMKWRLKEDAKVKR